ncbi:MAG: metallophosphoesterase [Clostridia bacterium]|nr:metallophosphoesterase [Clostridia bacterium]
MIKITVISDTHGNLRDVDALAEIMMESDYVFHLGDHYDDMKNCYHVLGDKLYRVHGNCDWGSLKDIVVKVGDVKIFATHGDLYGAKHGVERLVKKAKEEKCSVVLYGHTHISAIVEKDGVLLINPGTLSKYASKKTFAYIVINGDKVTPVINEKFFSGR